MSSEFGGKWGTECLNTKFPLLTLLSAGYSVKLKKKTIHKILECFRIFERGGVSNAASAGRRGELTLEASRDAAARPRQPLRARRVATTAKRKKVGLM